MKAQPLLRIDGVSKFCGKSRAVADVSLEVHQGGGVALLGPNGAGKSATVLMGIGIVKPAAGHVAFLGAEVPKVPTYQRSRRGMGFLPQERSIFGRLSVEGNLQAVLETRKNIGGNPRVRKSEQLAEYGLARLANQKAHTLSGGETRRLEVCRAMVTNPSMLMLDEPFSGVDSIAVGELQGVLRRLRDRGIGVLLSEPHVRGTPNVRDRAYIMNEGKILMHRTPAEIEGPL